MTDTPESPAPDASAVDEPDRRTFAVEHGGYTWHVDPYVMDDLEAFDAITGNRVLEALRLLLGDKQTNAYMRNARKNGRVSTRETDAFIQHLLESVPPIET